MKLFLKLLVELVAYSRLSSSITTTTTTAVAAITIII